MLGPEGLVHRGVLAFLAAGALIATVVSATGHVGRLCNINRPRIRASPV